MICSDCRRLLPEGEKPATCGRCAETVCRQCWASHACVEIDLDAAGLKSLADFEELAIRVSGRQDYFLHLACGPRAEVRYHRGRWQVGYRSCDGYHVRGEADTTAEAIAYALIARNSDVEYIETGAK